MTCDVDRSLYIVSGRAFALARDFVLDGSDGANTWVVLQSRIGACEHLAVTLL